MTGIIEETADNGASSRHKTTIAVLKQKFSDRVHTGMSAREQHGHTTTWIENQPPDAVIIPNTTEEVAEIVNICREYKTPVIAFGTGTSLEGHLNAPFGGVCVDFSNMKKVLSVNTDDLDCTVEAGVTRKELNTYLRDTGLFFTVDPGADASLGGMAATRASGTNAVRYGTMSDVVINVTAVLADGSIVRTGSRARKTSAGYDLTHLLIGSEGTLGIITELTLRLQGIPESILSAVCSFDTLKGACQTVIEATQMGLKPARIELLDPLQIRACNAYSNLTLAEKPTLFLEFHGTGKGSREEAELFAEIAAANGGGDYEWAQDLEDRNRLWQARHDAYWAARALIPGADCCSGDVCVPISRLTECVEETRLDIENSGIVATIVGHVGDGNFHVLPLFDAKNPGELEAVQNLFDRMVTRAQSMEGTCTGEHGVGSGKTKYLRAEYGAGVEIMRSIKQALDPDNILNPGKIFESSPGA